MQQNLGNVGSATPGTQVTTGGAAATKGTPAELIASTAFNSYLVCITATNYGAGATTSRGCLDILVGAATEEVLIANLLMGFCGQYGAASPGPKRWVFPLYIPAGTRIAAQAAGDRTTTAMRVGIELYGGNGYPPFKVAGVRGKPSKMAPDPQSGRLKRSRIMAIVTSSGTSSPLLINV